MDKCFKEDLLKVADLIPLLPQGELHNIINSYGVDKVVISPNNVKEVPTVKLELRCEFASIAYRVSALTILYLEGTLKYDDYSNIIEQELNKLSETYDTI